MITDIGRGRSVSWRMAALAITSAIAVLLTWAPPAAAQNVVDGSGTPPASAPKGSTCHQAKVGKATTATTVCVARKRIRDLTAAEKARRAKHAGTVPTGPQPDGGLRGLRPNTIVAPTQCAFGNGNLEPAPDRFTSCSDVYWYVTDYELDSQGNEQLVGEIDLENYQWVLFSQKTNDPSWTHGLMTRVDYAYGTLLGELGAISSHCAANLPICEVFTSALPDPTSFTFVEGATFDNEWVEDSPQTITNTSNLVYLNFAMGTDFVLSSVSFLDDGSTEFENGLAGRCDTISPSWGCINWLYRPTLTYDSTTNPLVAPVAQHIYNAQHSLSTAWGVPGNDGNALYRDTNQADIDANRRAACGGVTVPTGQSCDEYPMASTYEGAAFQSIYSTTLVPESANSSQGGITGNFYTKNHILDGSDPFWVLAILSNGTRSW